MRLNERWPGYDIRVHVFGSSGNLLCTSDSDGMVAISGLVYAAYKISGYMYNYTDEGTRTDMLACKGLGRA